ncbi:endonuclease/exonuclease/phosphatase family protein [Jatrophihabitans sp.]|uniref:endonuclease/exonuclease/phosphatase family protein n=1 Tax=Jatrophihabitans sp. TaxID=1932789 RepID=UPI0030C77AD1|nr:Metal-dependent hydrolase, endonuclease/exonuclease/phosphatase family [Jatrophihabitans sp.]
MRLLHRARVLVTVAATAATLAVVAVSTAQSAQAAPVYPSGAHLTAISHSAIRVGLDKVADSSHLHVTSYRLVASTVKADVVTSYLNSHGFKSTYSGSATTNSVLITGMKYTTAPYYYRVGITYSEYSNYVAWGQTYSNGFGLAPAAPTGVKAVSGSAGNYIQWTPPASGSTGAAIDQTNTKTGTTATYTIHNTTPKFTPYGLGVGTQYTYRVRAINIATHSPASASSGPLTGLATTKLRVMSYNVLGAYLPVHQVEADGHTATIAGWDKRVVTAAALVKKYAPDVLTVQEGDTILGADGTAHTAGNHAYPSSTWPGDWWSTQTAIAHKADSCNRNYANTSTAYIGGAHYWPYRQADALCDYTNQELGKTVATGYVSAIDGTPKHNGSTNYLIYNTATMQQLTAAQLDVSTAACWGSDDPTDTVPTTDKDAVTCGGYWSLDDSTGFESASDTSTKPTERKAGWAAFTIKATGTRVLVISPHTSAETGSSFDARRKAQVTNMVALAQQKAAALGIHKIIYAGDFNNYVGRPSVPDETTPVMKAAGYPDSIENAQHSFNTSYLSGNFYNNPPERTPGDLPAYDNLDHIYIYPGIAVQNFGEGLILTNGKFVGAIPSDHNPVWADLYVKTAN